MPPRSIRPIIVSQDLDPATQAASHGVAHAAIQRGVLAIALPGEPTLLEHPVPKTPFAMRRLGGTGDAEWAALADWLQTSLDAEPVLVLDNDHPLREFALYAAKRNGLRFGLRHAKPAPPARVIEYALYTNACVHLFSAQDIEDDFARKFIGPFRAVATSADLTAALEGEAREVDPPPARKRAATTELLIVSYFSGPCRSVGVQRPNYWFDEIDRLSNGRVRPHLATAIDWNEDREGLHVVPDHHAASLLTPDGTFPDWGRSFIATDERNARNFNTLSHYWRIALERYFDMRDDQFDIVLISGNPFSCFDFAAYAKRRWGARVILDYRDPFANNPRFLYRDEQREHARYVERGYNFQCDLAVTVNEACVSYLEGDAGLPAAVVENGFDERQLIDIETRPMETGRINFVHAGSFYHDRSPRALVRGMDPTRHRFHHIGQMGGLDDDLLSLPQLVPYGRRPYRETLGLLGGAHCGVVFLSETAFETTTKVYDYLAVGLEVLICTHGPLRWGALAEMLSDEENVHWCRNTDEGVAEFIASYRPKPMSERPSGERYSRGHSTSVLIERIVGLA